MDVYVFQAALICTDCSHGVQGALIKPAHVDMHDESSYDSDEWPKGPYSNGGGEADTPCHCDLCGVFLENPLTPDGDSYVRELAAPFETAPDMSWDEIATAAEEGGSPILGEWIRFYFQWG